METTTLGKSDLRVSRLGFGCWQLGGHGWQDVDQQAVVQALRDALTHGLNFFDTADVYGLGESETLLGQTLPADALVATKFGLRVIDGVTTRDNSRAWMMQAVGASLKRLKRDTIDLYQLHWHDGRPLDDIFSDLEELRTAGKIRWYGVSNLDGELPSPPPGMISFTCQYSMLHISQEPLIRRRMKDGLGFIAWGALAQGLLAGKYHRESRFAEGDVRARADSLFAPHKWNAYEPLLATLAEAAQAHDKTQTQTALRWLLDTLPGSVALAGIKNPKQLSDNLGALGWALKPEWQKKLSDAAQTCQAHLLRSAA